MKRYLFIGSVLIILVGLLVVLFYPSAPAKQPTGSGTATTLPNAGGAGGTTEVGGSASTSASGGGTLSLLGQDGSNVMVSDFIHNGETIADSGNPGLYVLAGSTGYCTKDGTCPSGASTTDFTATYNANTQFFNIILLKEPLGNVRTEAEQFLEDRLGISEAQMCVLQYFVSTPFWVNASFTGRNLGFSFCQGAMALPQ